jgi:hypothetical protein
MGNESKQAFYEQPINFKRMTKMSNKPKESRPSLKLINSPCKDSVNSKSVRRMTTFDDEQIKMENEEYFNSYLEDAKNFRQLHK